MLTQPERRMTMSSVHGYITKEQVDDLSRTFSVNDGYRPLAQTDKLINVGCGVYSNREGARQINEAIRRELEESLGVQLKSNRKQVALQLSMDGKEWVTHEQYNKRLMTTINEAANEISKRTVNSKASYVVLPPNYISFQPACLRP